MAVKRLGKPSRGSTAFFRGDILCAFSSHWSAYISSTSHKEECGQAQERKLAFACDCVISAGGRSLLSSLPSGKLKSIEGYRYDAGAYSFTRSEGENWLPEGVESFKLLSGREIDSVLLANDYVVLMHDGRKVREFTFTKAVLLRTGLEYVAFSMDDFSEDAIVRRRGFDPDVLAPDGSGSWYDKPGWTDEYGRKFEAI